MTVTGGITLLNPKRLSRDRHFDPNTAVIQTERYLLKVTVTHCGFMSLGGSKRVTVTQLYCRTRVEED